MHARCFVYAYRPTVIVALLGKTVGSLLSASRMNEVVSHALSNSVASTTNGGTIVEDEEANVNSVPSPGPREEKTQPAKIMSPPTMPMGAMTSPIVT